MTGTAGKIESTRLGKIRHARKLGQESADSEDIHDVCTSGVAGVQGWLRRVVASGFDGVLLGLLGNLVRQKHCERRVRTETVAWTAAKAI